MTKIAIATETRMITVGDQVKFWSEKVFGVPVHGTVVKITWKYIHIEANFHGNRWIAKVGLSRILED